MEDIEDKFPPKVREPDSFHPKLVGRGFRVQGSGCGVGGAGCAAEHHMRARDAL